MGHPTTPVDVLHCTKRLAWGPTPALVAEITRVGIDAWIDSQLAWTSVPENPVVADIVSRYPMATTVPTTAVDPGSSINEVAAVRTARAVWSNRQLFEKVVEVFADHFSMDILGGIEGYFMPDYIERVLRPGVGGTFADLLVATAKHGSMLNSLDQVTSRADRGRIPNENYARELLELHTTGVASGYSETDVRAVAHLLTGWTLTDRYQGTFTFNATWHNPGPFTDPAFSVLGWSRGALSGQAAGEAFLRHLAMHPATRTRVSWKLAVRFIGEYVAPTDAVVTAAASTWSATNGDIREVLRTIITSDAFWSSGEQKVRRPIEYLAACLRAIRATYDTTKVPNFRDSVVSRMTGLGNLPYRWPSPDGYPDLDAKWLDTGALALRWNLATATGQVNGLQCLSIANDLPGFLGTPVPADRPALVDRIVGQLLGQPISAAGRDGIITALGTAMPTGGAWSASTVRTAIALTMAQPEAQTC